MICKNFRRIKRHKYGAQSKRSEYYRAPIVGWRLDLSFLLRKYIWLYCDELFHLDSYVDSNLDVCLEPENE